MSPLFRRGSGRKGAADSATTTPSAEVEAGPVDAATTTPSAEVEAGPFDVAEVSGRGARLDFGALWVPVMAGFTLRMDLQRATGQAVAVSLSRDGSTLRLQVFAAPKSSGLWEEVRQDLVASAEAAGGKATVAEGRLGPEVKAELPVEGTKSGKQRSRFIGADGPRWFLRGQITGKAALDDAVAAPFVDLFRQVVVVRGTEARPPRELLALTAPGEKPANDDADGQGGNDGLGPLGRGPEVAEVR